MDQAAAEQKCKELAETSPERETHRWMPRRDADGGWSVVKVGLSPKGKLTAEQRADEKPPTPDDPRPLVNPYWGAG